MMILTIALKSARAPTDMALENTCTRTIDTFCGHDIIDAVTLAKPLPHPAKRKN
jgi:hypothetical protein